MTGTASTPDRAVLWLVGVLGTGVLASLIAAEISEADGLWVYAPAVAAVLLIILTAPGGVLSRARLGTSPLGRAIAALMLLTYLVLAPVLVATGRLVPSLLGISLLAAASSVLTWGALRTRRDIDDIVSGVALLLSGVAVLLLGVGVLRGGATLFGVAALLSGVATLLGGVGYLRGGGTLFGVAALLSGVALLLGGVGYLRGGATLFGVAALLFGVALLLLGVGYLRGGVGYLRGGATLFGVAALLFGVATLTGAALVLSPSTGAHPTRLQRFWGQITTAQNSDSDDQ